MATLGLDEVKVHQALDVDVGGFKVRLLTLFFITMMSPKGPSTGAMATTVNLIEAPAGFQFAVPDCVA
jgi:hypothetical protein